MELEIGIDSLSENLDTVEFARPLGDRQNPRVYLITYSRANLKTFLIAKHSQSAYLRRSMKVKVIRKL